MRTIYGPVMSWRVGECLNVDPICRTPKVCSFDCTYCKFGSSGFVVMGRSNMIDGGEFLEDLLSLSKQQKEMTMRFSGSGEPTLAQNLGELIDAAKKGGVAKTVVVTNSSLLDRIDVREEVGESDVLIAKLDASNEREFERINRPHPDIRYSDILGGLHSIRSSFKGSFRVQVMLVDENRHSVDELALLCQEMSPEIVYLSTPTRSVSSTALNRKALLDAAKRFEYFGCHAAVEGKG